ncbi:MAG: GlsB/YeaQ/YmgE family stress response membrane protein [Mycobacterium sp.]
MVWHIIWIIIIGLIVGAVARFLVPGKQPMGLIATAVLGIVGAFLGGTLGSLIFEPHEFNVRTPVEHTFLGALIGAVILLLIYKFVTARTRKT